PIYGAWADLAAVLVHQPAARLTLDRAVVQRAAELAPLLFRMQEALAPPAAERTPRGALRDALVAAGETFGDGALELRGLALGEYGVDPAGDDDDDDDHGDDGEAAAHASAAAPPALIRLLVDAIAAARAGDRDVIALPLEELDAVLPAGAPPPSFELLLTPGRTDRGWLLGLHAPA